MKTICRVLLLVTFFVVLVVVLSLDGDPLFGLSDQVALGF